MVFSGVFVWFYDPVENRGSGLSWAGESVIVFDVHFMRLDGLNDNGETDSHNTNEPMWAAFYSGNALMNFAICPRHLSWAYSGGTGEK